MAKRKSKPKKEKRSLIRLIAGSLPTWIVIMIICVGVCFGALVESGLITLKDVREKLDVLVFDSAENSSVGTLPDNAKKFYVSVIDVGQGDSILIYADGKSALIDAAEREAADDIIKFIRSKGITHLNYVIATHPHADHIGGMGDVINEFGADKVIIPRLPDNMTPITKNYERFLTSVKNDVGKLTAAKAGNSYELAIIDGTPVTMTILTPVDGAAYSDLNDYSAAVRLDYGNVSWLLTGDLSEEGEKDLINSGADIDVTAYKAGHHGSSTSSGEAFLARVTPLICVISCGKDNSYGHPHNAALERMGVYTDKIYRTDRLGTITVYSDGEKMYVTYLPAAKD